MRPRSIGRAHPILPTKRRPPVVAAKPTREDTNARLEGPAPEAREEGCGPVRNRILSERDCAGWEASALIAPATAAKQPIAAANRERRRRPAIRQVYEWPNRAIEPDCSRRADDHTTEAVSDTLLHSHELTDAETRDPSNVCDPVARSVEAAAGMTAAVGSALR